jgi:DNA-binding response OmpR family regulator
VKIGFIAREARSKHRVLLVDDYPDAAEVASMLLTIYGHDCRIAHSGQEALRVADEFDPQIVVLDISLPDVSGYDVARELRRRWGGRPLHLAAVTGWGQPKDRARAFDAGFDQHLVKPTDAAKLKSIIQLAERDQEPEPAVELAACLV